MKLIIRVVDRSVRCGTLEYHQQKALTAALHERQYENEQEAKGELSNKSPVVGWSFVQC